MKIFIGSSTESLEKAEMVALLIEKSGHEPKIWTDEGFIAGKYILECIIDIANTVDAAIFIFNEDDKQWYRETEVTTVRDNVLIEYGLFYGVLGRNNVAICTNGKPRIASDLSGLICINLHQKFEIKNKLNEWLDNCQSKQDIPNAQFALAEIYKKDEKYTEAVHWYKQATIKGHVRAQCLLGIMYLKGWGVIQNDKESAYWFRQSAKQGDSEAQSYLGWMYMNGKGVDKNYEQALFYFKEAIKKGWSSSKANLGWMYENGYGVTKDYEQALYWYKESIKQDSAAGYNALGRMYENGLGVSQDFLQAIFFYNKAVEKGHDASKASIERLSKLSG